MLPSVLAGIVEFERARSQDPESSASALLSRCGGSFERSASSTSPHHLPAFITAPGETDVLMVAMGILLIVAVLVVGNLYLKLHTLPERMAHKSQKLQFEIVAILGLLALFTHVHLFWIAGLFLALIDLPDFGTPLRSIANSVEKIAGAPSNVVVDGRSDEAESKPVAVAPEKSEARPSKAGVHSHA